MHVGEEKKKKESSWPGIVAVLKTNKCVCTKDDKRVGEDKQTWILFPFLTLTSFLSFGNICDPVSPYCWHRTQVAARYQLPKSTATLQQQKDWYSQILGVFIFCLASSSTCATNITQLWHETALLNEVKNPLTNVNILAFDYLRQGCNGLGKMLWQHLAASKQRKALYQQLFSLLSESSAQKSTKLFYILYSIELW